LQQLQAEVALLTAALWARPANDAHAARARARPRVAGRALLTNTAVFGRLSVANSAGVERGRTRHDGDIFRAPLVAQRLSE
jgi:hypothetical protein